MEVSKDQIIASISRAKVELDSVLENLEHALTFDPSGTRMVAHALNNLLTVMFGTVDLLSFEIEGTSNPQTQEYIQTLSQTMEKCRLLVKDLFTSTASSNINYDFGIVNMNKMILYAVDHYTRVANRKGVELQKNETDASIDVWADRIGVAVILDNLLSNAVKYTRPGGKVRVNLEKKERSVLCSICDEGPGIAKEDLGRLFQAGIRLSAVPTAGEPSTGYGLAVAKRVVDDMHAEIWCDSEYGHGACFRFRLPTNPPTN